MKINKRGFTLVELLVVITIIAILGAILLPAAVSMRSRSHKASVIAYLKVIDSGIRQYKTDYTHYPFSCTIKSGASGWKEMDESDFFVESSTADLNDPDKSLDVNDIRVNSIMLSKVLQYDNEYIDANAVSAPPAYDSSDDYGVGDFASPSNPADTTSNGKVIQCTDSSAGSEPAYTFLNLGRKSGNWKCRGAFRDDWGNEIIYIFSDPTNPDGKGRKSPLPAALSGFTREFELWSAGEDGLVEDCRLSSSSTDVDKDNITATECGVGR